MKIDVIFYSLIFLILSSCFTGVENTKRISEREVTKVQADKKTKEEIFIETVQPEPFIAWRPGKKFFVTNDNIKLIFSPSNEYNLENLSFENEILTYQGYRYEKEIDNAESVVLRFSDSKYKYKYNTEKGINDLSRLNPENVVPFLIDMDYVHNVDSLLKGKVVYIKTSLWLDEKLNDIDGFHFVPVELLSVIPGNTIYPFLVKFKYDNKTACVFMSSPASSMQNMTFDKLFSFSDLRKDYPQITDSNWFNIIQGKVALGMTKEECSLSLGAPKSIDRNPTHGGLYEKWSYDNGVYLIFEDGILIKYRS